MPIPPKPPKDNDEYIQQRKKEMLSALKGSYARNLDSVMLALSSEDPKDNLHLVTHFDKLGMFLPGFKEEAKYVGRSFELYGSGDSKANFRALNEEAKIACSVLKDFSVDYAKRTENTLKEAEDALARAEKAKDAAVTEYTVFKNAVGELQERQVKYNTRYTDMVDTLVSKYKGQYTSGSREPDGTVISAKPVNQFHIYEFLSEKFKQFPKNELGDESEFAKEFKALRELMHLQTQAAEQSKNLTAKVKPPPDEKNLNAVIAEAMAKRDAAKEQHAKAVKGVQFYEALNRTFETTLTRCQNSVLGNAFTVKTAQDVIEREAADLARQDAGRQAGASEREKKYQAIQERKSLAAVAAVELAEAGRKLAELRTELATLPTRTPEDRAKVAKLEKVVAEAVQRYDELRTIKAIRSAGLPPVKALSPSDDVTRYRQPVAHFGGSSARSASVRASRDVTTSRAGGRAEVHVSFPGLEAVSPPLPKQQRAAINAAAAGQEAFPVIKKGVIPSSARNQQDLGNLPKEPTVAARASMKELRAQDQSRNQGDNIMPPIIPGRKGF